MAKLRYNRPGKAMGPKGKARELKPLKANAHVAQRTTSGFSDHKGYKGSAPVSMDQYKSRRPPQSVPREAGLFQPRDDKGKRGVSEDIADTKRMNREITSKSASVRRDGRHTGSPSKGDTNIRKGAVGLSKGSAPPGTGKGFGVMGSPKTHAGTAGRGAPGRFGKADSYTGKSKPWAEEISHKEFEGLGAK